MFLHVTTSIQKLSLCSSLQNYLLHTIFSIQAYFNNCAFIDHTVDRLFISVSSCFFLFIYSIVGEYELLPISLHFLSFHISFLTHLYFIPYLSIFHFLAIRISFIFSHFSLCFSFFSFNFCFSFFSFNFSILHFLFIHFSFLVSTTHIFYLFTSLRTILLYLFVMPFYFLL